MAPVPQGTSPKPWSNQRSCKSIVACACNNHHLLLSLTRSVPRFPWASRQPCESCLSCWRPGHFSSHLSHPPVQSDCLPRSLAACCLPWYRPGFLSHSLPTFTSWAIALPCQAVRRRKRAPFASILGFLVSFPRALSTSGCNSSSNHLFWDRNPVLIVVLVPA